MVHQGYLGGWRRVRFPMGCRSRPPHGPGGDHPPEDEQRSLSAIRDALRNRDKNDAFDRVISSNPHDEVASGRTGMPQEISSQHPEGW